MKLTRTLQFHPALFPIVPVVNVLFLVFMLFAMSSRFVLLPGVAISLPASPFSLGAPQQPQLVSVTSAPLPAIYYHDRRVTLDEFAARLAVGPGQPRTIVIKADQAAPYDLIVRITNEALKKGCSVVLAASPEPRK